MERNEINEVNEYNEMGMMQVLMTDDRGTYIQNNVETYIQKFNTLEMKGSSTGWNWCGFLFGPAWMLFRKLYFQAIVFFFAPALLEVALLLVSPNELVYTLLDLVLTLSLAVLAGMYSDAWYKTKIDRLVREGALLQGEEKAEHIKKGGCSYGLLIAYVLLSFAWSMVTSLI